MLFGLLLSLPGVCWCSPGRPLGHFLFSLIGFRRIIFRNNSQRVLSAVLVVFQGLRGFGGAFGFRGVACAVGDGSCSVASDFPCEWRCRLRQEERNHVHPNPLINLQSPYARRFAKLHSRIVQAMLRACPGSASQMKPRSHKNRPRK